MEIWIKIIAWIIIAAVFTGIVWTTEYIIESTRHWLSKRYVITMVKSGIKHYSTGEGWTSSVHGAKHYKKVPNIKDDGGHDCTIETIHTYYGI